MLSLPGFRTAALASGFACVLLAIPPLRLERRPVERQLSAALGAQVRAEDASLRLTPWPRAELRGATAELELPGLAPTPVTLRADRVQLTLARLGSGEVERAELVGVAVDSGPIELRDGRLELTRRGAGFALSGQAQGVHGGFVDLAGDAGPVETALRLYLRDLSVRVPAALPGIQQTSVELRLDGVIALRKAGAESDELEIDLRVTGLQEGRASEWLSAGLRGSLVRQSGIWLPGRTLALEASLRWMDGADELRAAHGLLHGVAGLAGSAEAPRLWLDADLRELRMRLGEFLDKPAGAAARLRARARLAPDGATLASAELALARGRLQVDWSASEPLQPLRLHTSWLSLAELRRVAPLLARLDAGISGRAQVDGSWGAASGLQGRVRLEELALPALSARLRASNLDFDREGLRFRLPQLTLGAQLLSLSGQLRFASGSESARLRLDGRAGRLDLEQLARSLGSTIEDLPVLQPGGDPDVWRARLLAALCSRTRILDGLEVDSVHVMADQLAGFGVDLAPADLDLSLRDRVLRVSQGDAQAPRQAQRAAVRVFEVPVDRWLPRVAESD